MNTIFVNANILTQDKTVPLVQAIAVAGGRISAVGSIDEILSLRPRLSPKAEVIDLKGRTVLPGFTDGHTHFITGGFSLQALDLRGTASPDEFMQRIIGRIPSLDPGRWITGGGWDHEVWSGAPLPRKEWLDYATAEIPVFVTRIDLHIGLANSAALRAAGITAETPDPCGGEIFRDPATGEPTGILKDKAICLLESAMPKPSREEQTAALRAALKKAASRGITSIHDITDWGNSNWSEWSLFNDFRQRGELTCRIFARLPLREWDRLHDDLPAFRVGPEADPWLRFGGLKGFIDGSLGGRTACFFEPYADAPGYCGLLIDEMFPDGSMERRIRESDLAGIPVSVHAIGDRANALLLDIFSNVTRINGPRDRRLRIEHAQHLRPQEIARMADIGVIASIQPAQIIDDGGWAERRIGAERCRMAYAFQSLATAGIRLVSGSDWPVSPLDPLLGIHAALNRCTSDGLMPDGWQPEQKLSLTQAIESYTTNAAYAEFAETEKGSLSPGKFADLVVLSENPASVQPSAIKDIEVVMTMTGGSIVYLKC